ncbi:hypothetical protein O181_014613 [Austropuccinia psidii MF-1]|uniref:Uncharacterized protein n=1 Tax=Austropuccinia psidii MF-1 TaxID=1389203 RepID=A0A9Q3C1K4_9BASI|nr:hypothetical protein [Austropuccinia psidii MF-1]
MGGTLSAFQRENSGSSSQNPPTEGDSIINSEEEYHKRIHTDSTGKKFIFIQYLERTGIEDAGAQNASQEGQEEITSGVVVEFRIQQEETQPRARNNERILQGRNHHITRLVTKKILPSKASTESVHLKKFIYFLMGMPPSVDDFQPNPTNDEEKFHINWFKNCAKHIKTHLETFEYGLRDHPIIEKHACEKECQLGGLKMITFQWGTSFNNSTWNAAIANIISKHFFNWSQTQPTLNLHNPNQLSLLIEHLVNGRGKEMKKISKLVWAAEEVTASCFKIAHKLFPQNNKFSAIYTDIKATSDLEDNSDLGKAPKRLVGVWHSEALTLRTRQLDLAMNFGSKTQLEKNRVQHMLHMDGEKLDYNSDLTNVPHCLPLDCYPTIYLNTTSEVERSHLLLKEPIGLQNILLYIEAKTKRGCHIIQSPGRSSLSQTEAG